MSKLNRLRLFDFENDKYVECTYKGSYKNGYALASGSLSIVLFIDELVDFGLKKAKKAMIEYPTAIKYETNAEYKKGYQSGFNKTIIELIGVASEVRVLIEELHKQGGSKIASVVEKWVSLNNKVIELKNEAEMLC